MTKYIILIFSLLFFAECHDERPRDTQVHSVTDSTGESNTVKTYFKSIDSSLGSVTDTSFMLPDLEREITDSVNLKSKKVNSVNNVIDDDLKW